MGRRFPSANDHYHYSLESAHPFLSLSLFIAGMAVIITITTTLCGYGADKKMESKSSPKSEKLETDQVSESEETDDGSQTDQYSSDQEKNNTENGLPPPPSKQLRETYSCNNFSRTTSVSRRNMSKAMSMNLKRSVSEAKKQYHVEKKERKKLKNEDSVWMKTIILGEKCKVPGDDEEDHDEETAEVLVDGKGRKVRAYHPRTMSTYGLSRTNSSIDHTTTTTPSQSVDDVSADPHHLHVLVSSNNPIKEEQK